MAMRKIFAALLLCALLSGCFDYKDLDKLCVVTGMAFDKGEDEKIKVALEVVERTTQPREKDLQTLVVEEEGKTISEAVKKLSKGLDFELYYGAMALAVIGEDVARQEVFEWLLENGEVRETVLIIYTDEAGKKLQSEEDGGIAAYKLRDILEASRKENPPLELYKAWGAT
jgi:spore germination protein KC